MDDTKIKFIDEIDDTLWYDVIVKLAELMGIADLTNDEFTNEDIMLVRHKITDQLEIIKQERREN